MVQRGFPKHCRQHIWKTRYYRSQPNTTAEQEATDDLIDWVSRDLDKILTEHEPEALPEAIDQQIDEILANFGAA